MDFLPQWLSLLVVSVATGIGMLWIFRHTSDQTAIRKTKKKLQAHLLEMRLYADDPLVVWRAQKRLFAENARYILLMLQPALVATVPMILLLIVLDGYYGRQPLRLGEETLVTIQMADPINPELPSPELRAPDEIAVLTPAVRAMSQQQVSWRIKPLQEFSGHLSVVNGDTTVTKNVRAGSGSYLSKRRVRSLISLLAYPGEMPIDTDEIEWIELEYPSAGVRMLGLETHWLVWFLILSMASAFLLKGKFNVTV